MKIFRTISDLTSFLTEHMLNNPESKIGFVPTMGALHAGHISLIKQATFNSNLVVCSIFVNPTQFNNADDLEIYPRTEEADIKLLQSNNCDVVFIPSVSDIYPKDTPKYSIDLNGLDKVMEGKYRDGHFNGVCMVVERLFNIIKPDFGFFGNKDFQQVAVLRHMVKIRNFDTQIISCPILREINGLAMSSRNTLLSTKQKQDATVISRTLFEGIQAHKNGFSFEETKNKMMAVFNSGNLKLEYLEIVDNKTLKSVSTINENTSACIVAYCGKVRLIDNCQFS